jgi:hypothetical protein
MPSEGRVQAVAAALAEQWHGIDWLKMAPVIIAADDAYLAEHPDEAPWLELVTEVWMHGTPIYRAVKP